MMTTTTNPFALALREYISAGGLTQKEIAQRAGVNEKTLRNTLSGVYAPREVIVRRLASCFGCDPDEMAVLAGYPDVRIAGADPRQFTSLPEGERIPAWLRASLDLRNE